MSEHELDALLDAFGAAFEAQDPAALRALFDEDEASLVTSDALVLRDRAAFETFVDAYAAQPVGFSFAWDERHVSEHGDTGFVVAFGREIAHRAEGEQAYPFRVTMVARRRASGWRIVHVHASTPD